MTQDRPLYIGLDRGRESNPTPVRVHVPDRAPCSVEIDLGHLTPCFVSYVVVAGVMVAVHKRFEKGETLTLARMPPSTPDVIAVVVRCETDCKGVRQA